MDQKGKKLVNVIQWIVVSVIDYGFYLVSTTGYYYTRHSFRTI